LTHTSLRSQIKLSLRSLLKLGEKRHEYKKRGEAHLWIFYYQTYRMYTQRCWSVIKQIRDRYGVNMLIKIKPWMVREEFARRIKEGQSAWTLKAYRSALIKLERGIEHFYGYKVRLVPRDMELPERKVKLRRNRFAYTPKQTKAIIDAAYSTGLPAAEVLDLIAWTGLRLSEALKLRAKDIQGDILVVFKGKGGKCREVPIPAGAENLINRLCECKSDMDLLFPKMTRRKIYHCMEKACALAGITVHMVHNLRHQYAVKRYKIKRNNGASDIEARLEVAKELGHSRRSVTYAYAPPVIRPGWRG